MRVNQTKQSHCEHLHAKASEQHERQDGYYEFALSGVKFPKPHVYGV